MIDFQGVPYYIRIREYGHTIPKCPPRGQLEQLLSTNFYCYSNNRLVESRYDIGHQTPRMAVTVLSAQRIFHQKSLHVAPSDWSVPGEEGYGCEWRELRCDVSDGKCTLEYVCETVKPKINTQVSWLRVLAGASNISECSDVPALQAAGNPAIFWALIALSTEKDSQPLQLTDAVNGRHWRSPDGASLSSPGCFFLNFFIRYITNLSS